MGLQRGRTNNPHGRPAGVPNKMTKELRKILKLFVSNELKRLPKRIRFLKKLSRIIISVGYSGSTGTLSSFGWLKASATVRSMKGLLNNVFLLSDS